jgi:hypothetical protein
VYANGSGFSALAKGALRLAVPPIAGGAALSCNSLLSETERLRRKYNDTTITPESPVGPDPATLRSVGGSVSGLTGTLVLRINGANDLTITANVSYVFAAQLAQGAAYNVTAFTQPAQQAGQNCLITYGSGTVAGANVTNITVACTYVCTMTRLEVIQPGNWSLVQGYLQAEAAKGVTNDPDVYTIPGPPGTDRWHGGVLASNGKIYTMPRSSSSTILVIDTRSLGTLYTPVLESAYFNKY